MADEFIRLDTTIIAIDNLINKAATGTMARTLFEAKDTIYNQQRYVIDVRPVNQWISCKEQMPEDGISILICSERGTISKATYDSNMGYFYIADSELHYNQLDITHWQPLPQPPKDGDSK